MAEPEHEQELSARKLVLEAAKFNVLTAHSGREAMELIQQFPRVAALIVHADIRNTGCAEVVKAIKAHHPQLPTILLASSDSSGCDGIDHRVSSHDPGELLHLLRSLFGDPRHLEPQQA